MASFDTPFYEENKSSIACRMEIFSRGWVLSSVVMSNDSKFNSPQSMGKCIDVEFKRRNMKLILLVFSIWG